MLPLYFFMTLFIAPRAIFVGNFIGPHFAAARLFNSIVVFFSSHFAYFFFALVIFDSELSPKEFERHDRIPKPPATPFSGDVKKVLIALGQVETAAVGTKNEIKSAREFFKTSELTGRNDKKKGKRFFRKVKVTKIVLYFSMFFFQSFFSYGTHNPMEVRSGSFATGGFTSGD